MFLNYALLKGNDKLTENAKCPQSRVLFVPFAYLIEGMHLTEANETGALIVILFACQEISTFLF